MRVIIRAMNGMREHERGEVEGSRMWDGQETTGMKAVLKGRQ